MVFFPSIFRIQLPVLESTFLRHWFQFHSVRPWARSKIKGLKVELLSYDRVRTAFDKGLDKI